MKTEYREENILINVYELFCNMPDEDKIKLIEELSCEDAIIKHVVDQILDGWTENVYHGAILVTASSNPKKGLDYAMREVAKRSGEVAAKEIKRLEEALAEANKNYIALMDRTYRNEHR